MSENVRPSTVNAIDNNDNGFIENSVRGVADRALALLGNQLKAINVLAKKGDAWLIRHLGDAGKLYWDGSSIIPQWISSRQARQYQSDDFFDALANELIDVDMGYRAQYSWQQVKQHFNEKGMSAPGFGLVLAYAAEQGVQSIPDMLSAVLNLPAYITARAGEIGDARAVNKGKQGLDFIELLEALPFAVGAAALERVGAKGITQAGVENLGVEVLKRSIEQSVSKVIVAGSKAGLKEAGTEAVQSGVLEYLGERVLTDANLSLNEAVDQALAGAVAGGIYGAGAGYASGAINETRAKTADGTQLISGLLSGKSDAPINIELPKLDYYAENANLLVIIRDYLNHFLLERKQLTAAEITMVHDWAVQGVTKIGSISALERAELNLLSERLERVYYQQATGTKQQSHRFSGQWFSQMNNSVSLEELKTYSEPSVLEQVGQTELQLPNLDFIQASDRGRIILEILGNVFHAGPQAVMGQGTHLSAEQFKQLRLWVQKHDKAASYAWSKEVIDDLNRLSVELEIVTFNINIANKHLPVPHDGHVHNGGWFRGSYEPRVKHPVYGDENPLTWLFDQLDAMGQLSNQIFFSVAPYRSIADHRAGHTHDHLGYYALRQAGLRSPFDGVFKRNDKTGMWEADSVTIQRAVRDEKGVPSYEIDAYGARHVVRREEIIDGKFEISDQELMEQLGRETLPDDDLIHFGYTQTHHCNLCYSDARRDYAIAKDIIELPEKYREHALLGMVAGNPFAKDGWKARFEQLRNIVELESRYANEGNGHVGMIKIPGAGEITLAKEMVLGLVNDARVNAIGLLNASSMNNVKHYFKTLFETGGVAIVHADIGNVQPIAQRFPQLSSVNDNLDAIRELFRSLPNGRFVWAHGGGLGRFVMPGPNHIRMLRHFMQDPSLSHVNIDLSWDVINTYMVKNPDVMKQWARLVHDFPDRFIYGSDSVAVSQHTGITPHFTGFQMLEQAGFFIELMKLDREAGSARNTAEQFLRTNFENTFLPAASRTSEWRANKEVQKWLDEKGYDNSVPMPVVYPPVLGDDGIVSHDTGQAHYNLTYFRQRYGDAYQQQLSYAQAQQALPVFTNLVQ